MLDFIQDIVTSVTSLFLLVSSPFVGSTLVVSSPTPTPQVEQVQLAKASGTYSYQGYSSNITIEFPIGGGNVSGKIEGVCNGDIKGSYTTEGGEIKAESQGKCQVLIFEVDAKVDLTGQVLLDQKKVGLNFVGKAGDFTHNGAATLNFIPN